MLFGVVIAFAICQADLAKHVYPLARPITCPKVEIDVTAFPESQEWGTAAKGLVESWFGTLTTLLATESYKPLRLFALSSSPRFLRQLTPLEGR